MKARKMTNSMEQYWRGYDYHQPNYEWTLQEQSTSYGSYNTYRGDRGYYASNTDDQGQESAHHSLQDEPLYQYLLTRRSPHDYQPRYDPQPSYHEEPPPNYQHNHHHHRHQNFTPSYPETSSHDHYSQGNNNCYLYQDDINKWLAQMSQKKRSEIEESSMQLLGQQTIEKQDLINCQPNQIEKFHER